MLTGPEVLANGQTREVRRVYSRLPRTLFDCAPAPTPGFVKQGKKKGARCCPSIGKRPTVLVSLPQVAEVGRENPLGA